jgi:hypothetical protein
MPRSLISNLLGLVGAAIGGTVGFFVFGWLLEYSFYGLILPGAFLGLGCGLLAQHRSVERGIVCGLAAVLLALFTEWWYRPFAADNSLKYFLTHITSLTPVTFLMLSVGALIAYWVSKDSGYRWFPESLRSAQVEPGSERKPNRE